VGRAVRCAFERFDGKGSPAGLAGDEVSEAPRFAAVGFAAVMFDAVGGVELAVETVARWSGHALDPSIAAVFLDAPGELLTISNPDDVWAAVVDGEPQPRRWLRDEAHLDEALAGFGDAADLRSGHVRHAPRPRSEQSVSRLNRWQISIEQSMPAAADTS
jgi:hypothetical protein